MDRDRLLNDLANTGVIAALIGGFALGALDTDALGADASGSTDEMMRAAKGLLMYMAVHLCTFAAIASAFLYRKFNACSEAWAEAQGSIGQVYIIRQLPFYAFSVGTCMYICGVVLSGFQCGTYDRDGVVHVCISIL